MWEQPYLETCCRATLHRLLLCEGIGRPAGMKDGPCLQRLSAMGLACGRGDGRYAITAAGLTRHELEIARKTVAAD